MVQVGTTPVEKDQEQIEHFRKNAIPRDLPDAPADPLENKAKKGREDDVAEKKTLTVFFTC